MHPIEQYYLRQSGRESGTDISPIFSTPCVQRGHGIGVFFGCLFLRVLPIFWSGDIALGRETLRTGGNILSDIAENKATTTFEGRNIVSKHLIESRQNLINKLGGRGRKNKGTAKIKRKLIKGLK